MSAKAAKPGEANWSMFDRYSALHAAFGGLMGAGGLSITQAMAASIAWEMVGHNICVLISSVYELGIAPEFWKQESA